MSEQMKLTDAMIEAGARALDPDWEEREEWAREVFRDQACSCIEAALAAAAPGDDIESLPLPEDRIVTTRSVRFEYVKNPPPLIWHGDFDEPAAAPGDALDAREQAAFARGQFAAFLPDWDDPAMDVYDDLPSEEAAMTAARADAERGER